MLSFMVEFNVDSQHWYLAFYSVVVAFSICLETSLNAELFEYILSNSSGQ